MTRFPRRLKHGSGSELSLDPTHILLAFKHPIHRKEVTEVLRGVDLELEDGSEGPTGQPPISALGSNGASRKEESRFPSMPVNHTDQRYWVRSRSREAIGEERLATLETSLAGKLDWLGPVYRMGDTPGLGGLLCPLPNALVVKAITGTTDSNRGLAATLGKLGLEEVPDRSKHLRPYHYFMVPLTPGHRGPAYELQERLTGEKLVAEAHLENMPMLVPLTAISNDPLYPQQWDMVRIQAGGPGTTGWDISTGANGVVVCVLDSGCDLTHPDLVFSSPGTDLGDSTQDGSPNGNDTTVSPHGTCCAGIVAAQFSNMLGISGVAGACRILPVAFRTWTDVEVAAGINYAVANGAQVISMSFGQYGPGEGMSPSGWNFTLIDPAIQNAFNAGVVLCAATGNENIGTYNRYPARHPLVIACGASDQNDNRKSPSSPDGETWWGGNFGPELSVVAPGVQIPTTDRQGTAGYNNAAGTAGDYFMTFNGTSAATPHVAGLAALLFSEYPALTNVHVRNIIERTAEKVGTLAYATDPSFSNGPRNTQMGYGRINCLRALDFADVMIRDYAADAGTEPSTPPGGDFWDFSDIAIRIFDDGVFAPDDPSQSKNVERGQTNYLYIRVINNGVRDARNVVVDARITPWVGLQFIYPQDWNNIDAAHVRPTPVTASFASVPAGSSVIAKFTIAAAQVESLWGWIAGMNWHPCLLAQVSADNDYGFATADTSGVGLVVRRNNLAQRNLSVINVIAGSVMAFPFVAGNRYSRERFMEVVVNRAGLPRHAEVLLELDAAPEIFPRLSRIGLPASIEQGAGGGAIRSGRLQGLVEGWVAGDGEDGTQDDLVHAGAEDIMAGAPSTDQVLFLDRTRLETSLSGCHGVLTVEAGSRFEFEPYRAVERVSVQGGELLYRGNRRFVQLSEDTGIISLEKRPGRIYPMLLRVRIPGDTKPGQQFMIKVMQRNQHGIIVGGASTLYRVAARVLLPSGIPERLAERSAGALRGFESAASDVSGGAEMIHTGGAEERSMPAAAMPRRIKSRPSSG